jgi:toxin-antitoxin system PIN domain toxin
MTRALLDINVLLALLDSDHVDHRRAHAWLDANLTGGWASCALTENGFVRIISQARYPNPIAPAEAIDLLERAAAASDHAFWPCDATILDPATIDRVRLHGARQVTDAYLLALAVRHGGRLVTFDRSIALVAVPGATDDHLVVM